MKSVQLPNTITTIRESAFEGCKCITTFSIPESVTDVYEDAFTDCSNLKAVYITDLKAWCGINSNNNTSGNPLWLTFADLFLNNEKVVDLVIEDIAITATKFASFTCCPSIKSVRFGNNVSKISGSRIFQYCNNLQDVYLPSSMSSIDGFSFAWCNRLKNVYCGALIPPKLDTGWNNLDLNEYFAFYKDDFNNIYCPSCSKWMQGCIRISIRMEEFPNNS